MSANLLQHQSRLTMAADISRKADASRQNLYDELRRHEGAVGGLATALDCIDKHRSYIQRDFDEAKIDEEQTRAAMKRMEEVQGILNNLRETARINLVMLQGRHEQSGDFLSICRVMFDEEKRIVEAALSAMDAAEAQPEKAPEPKPQGKAPGPSLADQRRSEMRAVEGGKQAEQTKPKARAKKDVAQK